MSTAVDSSARFSLGDRIGLLEPANKLLIYLPNLRQPHLVRAHPAEDVTAFETAARTISRSAGLEIDPPDVYSEDAPGEFLSFKAKEGEYHLARKNPPVQRQGVSGRDVDIDFGPPQRELTAERWVTPK